MDLQDIKRRIIKDEDGTSNYINITIEEMDWLVEQAEKAEIFSKRFEILAKYAHKIEQAKIDMEDEMLKKTKLHI